MSIAKLWSAQPGVSSAHIVSVEADLTNGLHQFTVVGLPDKAIEESKDRVSSAIKNTGWKSPKQFNQKITISLAPAHIKKEGPAFDLPIALSYLIGAGHLSCDTSKRVFVGELSLSGEVKGVRGILGVALKTKEAGFKELYVPSENADEASLVEGISIFPTSNLGELFEHLSGKKIISAYKRKTDTPETTEHEDVFSRIRGQEHAKRALEIAAAGGHNILLYGPPGTGKTLLARALRSLLPPLSRDDMLEATAIHSAASDLNGPVTLAPFRAPHHTSSYVSIIGGGSTIRPGEATLAHRGVLFLDEFPEFDVRVIESLREPLEEGVIHIARAKGTERYPARFMMIAAMNPCPCGYRGDQKRSCTCLPGAIAKYDRKISGPIVDRIDMWVEVPRIEHASLAPQQENVDRSAFYTAQKRILAARKMQKDRQETLHLSASINAHMNLSDIDNALSLTPEVLGLYNQSAKKLDLSARAYHRTLKLARTIADLEGSEEITEPHILEALQYRPKAHY